MMVETFRGYEIEQIYIFSDTKEPVAETWKARPCGKCGKHNTPEGNDACLGTLSDVSNACCGHGVTDEAYIQFDDGVTLRGEDVAVYLEGDE